VNVTLKSEISEGFAWSSTLPGVMIVGALEVKIVLDLRALCQYIGRV
jgi:hypothetical protein